jgi:hypothetical protein
MAAFTFYSATNDSWVARRRKGERLAALFPWYVGHARREVGVTG